MAQFKSLTTRPLGKGGPQVCRLGLGLMGMGAGHYSNIPAPESDRLSFLDKAYELGERFWDTADMYADCEDILGKWFATNPEKRKDIFLATKFGIQRGPGGIKIDSSPEYCRASIEKSLARLSLPFVDLYYVHHLDKVTPIEKTMQAMAELKTAGKIKHIGLSECSAATLRRAYAVHPVTCVQMEYSAFTLDIESPERQFLQTARELGVAIVAFTPLGKGLLTGAIRSKADVAAEGDMRARMPRFSDENFAKNVAVVEKISDIAKAKGVPPAQLALAWLLAQGDDIFPNPGTTKPNRLAENLGALEVTLTPEEEQAIRKVAKGVSGPRLSQNIPFVNLYGDTPPLED